MLADINGWEFVIIVVLGLVLVGPERLPEYAARLAKSIRGAKAYADTARTQLKEQMGPEFEKVDWKAYDPRQYDPRKIVRDALFEPDPIVASGSSPSAPEAPSVAEQRAAHTAVPAAAGSSAMAFEPYDPDKPTPYDIDAT